VLAVHAWFWDARGGAGRRKACTSAGGMRRGCAKLRLPARAGIAGAPSDQPEGKDGGMGKTLPAVVRGAQSPAVAAPSVSAAVAAGLRWFVPHSRVGPR